MQTLMAPTSVAAPFTTRQPCLKFVQSSRCKSRVVARAAEPEVLVKPAETLDAPVPERKLSPLARGGTLAGEAAAGKDAGLKAKAAVVGSEAPAAVMQLVDGKFRDSRWVDGRWVMSNFVGADGKTDWDEVINAEMARRKLLEDNPIPSTNQEPVLFDTSEIPWWAWVRRFHLPEAEKLNGRAAMVGYVAALLVDQLTGYGLLDQQNSFLGKVLLHVTVFGILILRSSSDLAKYRNLLDEATFYDKQWQATWQGAERPSETEKTQ